MEDFGVQCEIVVFLLFGIFGFQVLVVDGIEQSRAVDADGRFEPDIYLVGRKGAAVGGDEVDIVGVGGNRHLGVDQFIGGTVGKGISPAVGIRFPGNLDFRRVYRSLERLDGKELRHACERGDVVVVVVIDDQQVSVAYLGGIEGSFLTFAVAVTRVAVHAGGADIERSQSAANRTVGGRGENLFEQGFTVLERGAHAGILDGGRRLFEGR